MKKKDKQELHQKTENELKELLVKLNQELVHLKMNQFIGNEKDKHSVLRKRKKIAIIKTIMSLKHTNKDSAFAAPAAPPRKRKRGGVKKEEK